MTFRAQRQNSSLRFVLPAIVFGMLLIVLGTQHHAVSDELYLRPTLIAPNNIKDFSLGYNEVIADGLWLRAIQDFDFCETASPDERDIKKKHCSRGWVFHMVDAITELAPDFKKPYVTGALMLSVLVNDIDGASAIYDKAILKFPNDPTILFNAAFNAMDEEHNSQKASELLVRAAQNGFPKWAFSLASRLQQRSGQLELAVATLKNALASNPDGPIAERLQQRLDEVEKELAKQRQSP